MTGSRILKLPEARSIFARSVILPSSETRRLSCGGNRSRLSSASDGRGTGDTAPGCVRSPRYFAHLVGVKARIHRRRPFLMSSTATLYRSVRNNRTHSRSGRPNRSPASGYPHWMASTNSASSFGGVCVVHAQVADVRQISLRCRNRCTSALAVPDVQIAVGLRAGNVCVPSCLLQRPPSARSSIIKSSIKLLLISSETASFLISSLIICPYLS